MTVNQMLDDKWITYVDLFDDAVILAHMQIQPNMANRLKVPLSDELVSATEHRRNEFAAGRLLAHYLLKRHFGNDEMVRRGKMGAPQWPAGIVGSISHSNGQVAVALSTSSQYKSLGIDMEFYWPGRKMPRPSYFIQNDGEVKLMKARARVDTEVALLLIWCAKEAAIKSAFPLTGLIYSRTNIKLYIDTQASLGLLCEAPPASHAMTTDPLRLNLELSKIPNSGYISLSSLSQRNL